MKNPFHKNTTALLAKAQADLAATEQAIVGLQNDRQTRLLDSEPGDIAKIDQKIADQHRVLSVYKDRNAALKEQHRLEYIEDIRAKREAAIKKLSVRMEARRKLAEQVEKGR